MFLFRNAPTYPSFPLETCRGNLGSYASPSLLLVIVVTLEVLDGWGRGFDGRR